MTNKETILRFNRFSGVAKFNNVVGNFAAQSSYMYKDFGLVELEFFGVKNAVVRFVAEKHVTSETINGMMNELGELLDTIDSSYYALIHSEDTEEGYCIEYHFTEEAQDTYSQDDSRDVIHRK